MKKNSTNSLEANDTALLNAIDQNNLAAFRVLFNDRVNLNCPDANNVSPLSLAAYNGNAAIVAFICMRNYPSKITTRDDLGNNPLHSVFCTSLFDYSKKSDYSEVTDIVHTLLNIDLDPNERNNANKSTFDLVRENNEINADTKEKVRKILDRHLLKTSPSSPQSTAAAVGNNSNINNVILPPITNPSPVVAKPDKKKAVPVRFGTLPPISENTKY